MLKSNYNCRHYERGYLKDWRCLARNEAEAAAMFIAWRDRPENRIKGHMELYAIMQESCVEVPLSTLSRAPERIFHGG